MTALLRILSYNGTTWKATPTAPVTEIWKMTKLRLELRNITIHSLLAINSQDVWDSSSFCEEDIFI